jgi:hypothetical protein
MLSEFCKFIEEGEVAAGTELGALLSLGDDDI